MADITPTETPIAPRAWLVQGASDLSAYAVHLADASAASELEVGHWVLILGKDGRASKVGRILRIRSDLDGDNALYFDIYFDRVLAAKVPLADLGLTAPTQPVAHLSWDDFLRALPLLGVANPDAVPSIKDVAYVRDLLELAVRDDLLGPAMGPNELVKDMSVRDRYLVGKLSPIRAPGDDREAQVEPASAADEIDDSEGEERASFHEAGAELERTSGRVDGEEDALDEIDTTKNQSLVPLSMGFTFFVAPNVETLSITVRWGRYERVPDDEHETVKSRKNRETEKEEMVKVKVWRRIPCGGVIVLPLDPGTIQPRMPDSDWPDVRLQGKVKASDKEKFVTLFLVNGQTEPSKNKDSAWLFQPEIAVEGADDQGDDAIFRRKSHNKIVVDDPEHEQLALIYRNRVEFAVGHGVSVHAETRRKHPEKAHKIQTAIIPRYEVATAETPGLGPEDRAAMRRLVDEGRLDMARLAEMEPEEMQETLSCLVGDYADWIEEQKEKLKSEKTSFNNFAEVGGGVIARCEEILARLKEGMDTLATDDKALEAFRFANRAMALQRVRSLYALERRRNNEKATVAESDTPENRSWRPFQLAFLLLSVPSLADPAHPHRTKPDEAVADLLWFPTGGGKTEAYLGVAAFAMAMRRLKSDLGGLDATRGLAVIMRYTLRLLTLQQFQRAATLLCAMEVIRRGHDKIWGKEPFSLGLWVGNRMTPGTTEEAHKTIETTRNNRNRTGMASPAQLTSCPWCGAKIFDGRDITVDTVVGKTEIRCSDTLGGCDFSQTPGLPVKVVDEEIYHHPPTMMIATVDKFAMMAWRGEVQSLFGRVNRECERHGLLISNHDCGTRHLAKGNYPAAQVKEVTTIRPPDLIIQDEFHLIGGPLGTMVGLYETAVDELSSWTLGDMKVRPKVIASAATIRRADDQMRNVFMRKLAVFPPSGLEVKDNFFSVQRETDEKPGRRYMGICAPGTSRPAVLIRTYTAFLTAAQAMFESFGEVADPYMTLVGYFNSLRELGGMKRMADDDVRARSFRVQKSETDRPLLARRDIKETSELTSRISSQKIPQHLSQLETRFEQTANQDQGKWSVLRKKGKDWPIDIVLATNMLSVGVDVNRLGLMVVSGQPKGTAEYIQATSRVGRAPPGLVATVLTWARPRDLSHYETYEHYHATFYQHVEAQSVTPFSPRALDRGLTGAMVSIMRHTYDPFTANDGARELTSPTRNEMQETIKIISERARKITKNREEKKRWTEDNMKNRADEWVHKASVGGRTLVYKKKSKPGPTDHNLLSTPSSKPWTNWTVPQSMREVEPAVKLLISDDNSTINDPEWKVRTSTAKGEGKQE